MATLSLQVLITLQRKAILRGIYILWQFLTEIHPNSRSQSSLINTCNDKVITRSAWKIKSGDIVTFVYNRQLYVRIGKQLTENKFYLLAVINSLMHSGVCWICLLCDNGGEAETKELYPGKRIMLSRKMRTFWSGRGYCCRAGIQNRAWGFEKQEVALKTLFTKNLASAQVNLFSFPGVTFPLSQTIVSLVSL